MLLSLLALVAVQAPQGFQTDTTVSVSQGTRLKVENQGGDIVVKTWDKNQVRVQASHSRRTHVSINLGGAVLSLEAEADHGPANMVDYELTVPVWMPLDLEGMYATVNIKGTRAPIAVETLDGDITVEGGAETVKLTSIQGRITVTGARGRIELNTVSDDIEAAELQGDIVAETVSGSITVARSDAKSVEIQTVSGELVYDGKILDGGHYSLLTHSGTIAMAMPEGANATIATAIGSGEVRASFPLPASERPSRRRQTFRLGTGSANVELESFSGTISLLRPAELASRLDRILERRAERDRRHKPRPEHDLDDDNDIHGGY
jgi:DUF4097 and DUF4098 domain-containing protein YvlB